MTTAKRRAKFVLNHDQPLSSSDCGQNPHRDKGRRDPLRLRKMLPVDDAKFSIIQPAGTQAKILRCCDLRERTVDDPLLTELFDNEEENKKNNENQQSYNPWDDFDDHGAYAVAANSWGTAPAHLTPEEMAEMLTQVEAYNRRHLEREAAADEFIDQLRLQAEAKANRRAGRHRKANGHHGPLTRAELLRGQQAWRRDKSVTAELTEFIDEKAASA